MSFFPLHCKYCISELKNYLKGYEWNERFPVTSVISSWLKDRTFSLKKEIHKRCVICYWWHLLACQKAVRETRLSALPCLLLSRGVLSVAQVYRTQTDLNRQTSENKGSNTSWEGLLACAADKAAKCQGCHQLVLATVRSLGRAAGPALYERPPETVGHGKFHCLTKNTLHWLSQPHAR